ncbi:MAG: ABC transporter permease [Myxococcota bacterium]
MSNWRMIRVLFVRELLKMVKEPSRLVGIIVQPLIFWVVIGSGFVPSFRVADNASLGYQDFFFVGIIAMVILFSAIFSTITLIDDRNSGFMQAVLVAPGGRFALVLGKVLGISALAMIQASLLIMIGALCGFSMAQTDWALLVLFLLLGSMALASLGFVFAWGSSSTAAYHALMGMILIPLWILSGAMFPPDTAWMKVVVLVNPIAWLVSGLRAAFAGGVAPLGSVVPALTMDVCLIALAIFAAVMIGLGSWLCRKG